MRGFGIETFLHGGQDFRDIFHVHNIAVGIEHFNESAHVRTLKVIGRSTNMPMVAIVS